MKYQTMTLSAAQAKGMRAQNWRVEDLYMALPEDGTQRVFWQSFGHVMGQERFGTHRMRRGVANNGDPEIHQLNSRAQVELRYPLNQGRIARLLVR